MAYMRDWDETQPTDDQYGYTTGEWFRKTKIDIAERLKSWIYGFISGESKVGLKKAPLVSQSSDPDYESDKGVLYVKEINGIKELFYRDSSGNVKQLTVEGKLNIETDEASVLNVDKVDGYDASTTPQANTIPVANGDGSIKDWITDQEILDKLKNVDGSGSGLDADLVRGEEPYHAFVRPPDYDSGWFTAPNKGTALKLTHGLGVKPSFVLFMLRNNDTGSIRIAVGQYIIYDASVAKYYGCSTTVITDQYISVFAGNYTKLGGSFANMIEGTSTGESDTDNVSLRVLCWK